MEKKKKMGLFDLMSMSIGQIIGSGIFTSMPIVLGLAGRGTSWGMLLGCLLCILTCIPRAIVSSLMELPGGAYTQGQMIFSARIAGVYGLVQAIGMTAYGTIVIGMATYTTQLFPGISSAQKAIALVYLTLFYLLGVFGPSLLSKLQNVMLIALLAALGIYIFGGLPHVQPGYFNFEGMFPQGSTGFVAAISLLTMSFAGGEQVANLSTEAKNPHKDIPLAIIASPIIVAVFYFLFSIVSAGIIPVAEVAAAGNLGVVAESFLSKPLYLFFMVGGALFALGTTLNSGIAFIKYPWLTMAEDGWLPKALTKKTKRFDYPYVLMIVLYIVGGFIPVAFDVSIDTIIGFFTLPCFILNIYYMLQVRKIDELYPNSWAKSPLHMSKGLLTFFSLAGAAAQVFVVYSLVTLNGWKTSLLSLGVGGALIVVILLRYSSGKVNMEAAMDMIHNAEAAAAKK